MGFGLTQYIPSIAYMICIIVVILTLFNDARIGLYLVTLLIPLQNLMERFIEFPFGKDIMDILLMAMIISIFIHGRRRGTDFHERKTSRMVLMIIPLSYTALWVGSYKLGLAYPVTFDNPQLILWKNFIMLPLLYFITINTIEEKKHITYIIWIMVITVFLMDVKFYSDSRWISHDSFSSTGRIVGVTFSYLGANEFAAFYAQVSMLFLGLLLIIKNKVKKIIFLSLIIFNSYCILFLYSRGAYVAILAGLLLYGVLRKRALLLLLIVILFAWNTILPGSVVERIEMTKSEDNVDESVLSRFELWTEALSNIKSNPVTGLGFGSTRLLGFKTAGNKKRNDVHNGYIEILLEQGLVGFIFIFYIFYVGIKKSWNLYTKSEDDFLKGLGLAFIGMIVACLATNLFGDRWSYLNLMGYFWITLGLVVKANQILSAEKESLIAD